MMLTLVTKITLCTKVTVRYRVYQLKLKGGDCEDLCVTRPAGVGRAFTRQMVALRHNQDSFFLAKSGI